LQQILNDSCAEVGSNSSDFWVMVAALKVIPKWHWWHLLFFSWIWYWHPICWSQV